MIVNFGPGGVTDLMARALASGMEKDLGQPVVVQNRPGALGTLGPAYVSKQAPDGYTLGTVSASVVTTTPHLMNVAVKPEDLIQVAGFGKNRYGIVVKQDSPLKTIDDLVQSAKGEKSVLFGSPSTPNSLIFFDLGRKTGGKFELVSYKAGPDSARNGIRFCPTCRRLRKVASRISPCATTSASSAPPDCRTKSPISSTTKSTRFSRNPRSRRPSKRRVTWPLPSIGRPSPKRWQPMHAIGEHWRSR